MIDGHAMPPPTCTIAACAETPRLEMTFGGIPLGMFCWRHAHDLMFGMAVAVEEEGHREVATDGYHRWCRHYDQEPRMLPWEP